MLAFLLLLLRKIKQMKPEDIPIGTKVRIIIFDSLSKAEILLLKSLDYIVTVEDHDIVPLIGRDSLFGIYVKELPGYLMSTDQIELLPKTSTTK